MSVRLTGQAGRPRKYNEPQEFDEMVDDYLETCAKYCDPVTWTGLALHLGFVSRQGLDAYANQYQEFFGSVKRAKALVEMAYEQRLHGQSPTGAIFALKNMRWKDRQEHGIDGGVTEEGESKPVTVQYEAVDSEEDSDADSDETETDDA